MIDQMISEHKWRLAHLYADMRLELRDNCQLHMPYSMPRIYTIDSDHRTKDPVVTGHQKYVFIKPPHEYVIITTTGNHDILEKLVNDIHEKYYGTFFE